MKKATKESKAERPPETDSADDYELLPEYDFSKMVPGKPIRKFHEGESVLINGKPFVVRGRSFVPAPSNRAHDNGQNAPSEDE